jgi:hypothetical protein
VQLPSDEEMERARKYFTEAPELSRNPVLRRMQRSSQWADPATLASTGQAEAWLRSRVMRHGSGPKPWELRDDYRLTPQSLPYLLDFVSSEERGMRYMAAFVLRLNGAVLRHNETESTDATLYWITLPDGSEYERPINFRND